MAGGEKYSREASRMASQTLLQATMTCSGLCQPQDTGLRGPLVWPRMAALMSCWHSAFSSSLNLRVPRLRQYHQINFLLMESSSKPRGILCQLLVVQTLLQFAEHTWHGTKTALAWKFQLKASLSGFISYRPSHTTGLPMPKSMGIICVAY